MKYLLGNERKAISPVCCDAIATHLSDCFAVKAHKPA